MAVMSDTPNRRSRRAAAATAPVAAAVDASAERAAIERDATSLVDIPISDTHGVPAADLPASDTGVDRAVMPEPTLVAEPGKPMPIVTASPILAVEPSAIDVVQADAKADRVAAGIEPAGDPDGPHSAAAGQPTLTLERDARGRVRGHIEEGMRIDDLGEFGTRTTYRDLSLDEVLRGLEHLALTDPIGMDIIRTRFFPDAARASDDTVAERSSRPGASTVTVIEVVGPLAGRRRAGRSFGPQPTRFFARDVGSTELAALRADSLLMVSVAEVPEAEAFAAVYG